MQININRKLLLYIIGTWELIILGTIVYIMFPGQYNTFNHVMYTIGNSPTLIYMSLMCTIGALAGCVTISSIKK